MMLSSVRDWARRTFFQCSCRIVVCSCLCSMLLCAAWVFYTQKRTITVKAFENRRENHCKTNENLENLIFLYKKRVFFLYLNNEEAFRFSFVLQWFSYRFSTVFKVIMHFHIQSKKAGWCINRFLFMSTYLCPCSCCSTCADTCAQVVFLQLTCVLVHVAADVSLFMLHLTCTCSCRRICALCF